MANRIESLDDVRMLVADRDDGTVYEQLHERGVEATLDAVFELLAVRITSRPVRQVHGVVEWTIGTPNGTRSYQLAVSPGGCRVLRDSPKKPQVTFFALLGDFLRIVVGDRDAMAAYRDRSLMVGGDTHLAMAVHSWLQPDG